MERGKYRGDRPTLEDAVTVEVLPYSFAMVWRDVGETRGITIHVFGPVSGRREEVLRFDCFDSEPHYHLGWSYRDEPFVPIADENPLQWALSSLSARFPELLIEAGADPIPSELSSSALQSALEELALSASAVLPR